jgi:hypothetical protein
VHNIASDKAVMPNHVYIVCYPNIEFGGGNTSHVICNIFNAND